MKTAAKVFIVLNFIASLFLGFVIYRNKGIRIPLFNIEIRYSFWFTVAFTFRRLWALIIAILTFHKLDTSTNKDNVETIGVLALLFCSVIGGICTLCVSQEELAKNGSPENNDSNQSVSAKDYTEKLKNLKSLLDGGIITEDEYNEKRKKYIGLL